MKKLLAGIVLKIVKASSVLFKVNEVLNSFFCKGSNLKKLKKGDFLFIIK